MSPRRVILTIVAATLCAGGTAPALASPSAADDTKRYCVALSSDPDKQEYAPLCVWVPGTH